MAQKSLDEKKVETIPLVVCTHVEEPLASGEVYDASQDMVELDEVVLSDTGILHRRRVRKTVQTLAGDNTVIAAQEVQIVCLA